MKLPAVPIDQPMFIKVKSPDGKTTTEVMSPVWKDYFNKQYVLVEALRVKNGL